MAAPVNLAEFYDKRNSVRVQFKEWKNAIKDEASDLKDVTIEWLKAQGLNDVQAAYEMNVLTKAKAVVVALQSFDNACV